MSILGTRVVRIEDPVFLTRGARLHRRPRRRRLAGARARHVRPFADRPRPHRSDRHVGGAGAARRRRRVHRRRLRATCRSQPRGCRSSRRDVAPAAGHRHRALRRRAGRRRSSPRIATRARTPPSWSRSTTTRCPPSSTRATPRATRCCSSRRPARTSSCANDVELDPDFFDGCEVVVSHEMVNQRVAAAPLEVRGRRGRLGRGRPATRSGAPTRARRAKRSSSAGSASTTDQVHIITPDVGGGFGAKFGAAPEHAVVAWRPARSAGRCAGSRPARRTCSVMPHGRGQVQTVTIGGTPRRAVLAYRLEVTAGLRRLPAPRRVPARR